GGGEEEGGGGGPRHERDEVGGHGALRAVAGGAGAVAVAREIRHDDGEARREPRRDRVPGGAALRIAVEEEQRRPAAGAPNEEPADVGGVKILEHRQGMYDAFAVRNLRVATCAELSEPDPDAEPLAAALADAGSAARLVAWDAPGADWDAPAPTIVRSTWNYALDREAFLAWAARVARAAPLWNPPDVLAANTHKRYLVELARRGVPVVPTALVERGASPEVAGRGWPRVVIKPAVGAGSLDARAFDAADPAAEEHARALAARVEVLIQPYIDSVHDHGERAVVWIDGELSHA